MGSFSLIRAETLCLVQSYHQTVTYQYHFHKYFCHIFCGRLSYQLTKFVPGSLGDIWLQLSENKTGDHTK